MTIRLVPTAKEFILVTAATFAVADAAHARMQFHGSTEIWSADEEQGPMLHGNAPSDRRFSLQGDNLSQRYSAERLAPFDCSRRTMHQLLLQASQECAGWRTPSVNLGEDGELELEWWNGDKSLTISINGEDISYLAAWGIDTQHEMRDGEIGDLKQFAEQWSWLQA